MDKTDYEQLQENEGAEGIVEDEDSLKLVFPPEPENTWKEEPQVTPEKLGTGANAKVLNISIFLGLFLNVMRKFRDVDDRFTSSVVPLVPRTGWNYPTSLHSR